MRCGTPHLHKLHIPSLKAGLAVSRTHHIQVSFTTCTAIKLANKETENHEKGYNRLVVAGLLADDPLSKVFVICV